MSEAIHLRKARRELSEILTGAWHRLEGSARSAQVCRELQMARLEKVAAHLSAP